MPVVPVKNHMMNMQVDAIVNAVDPHPPIGTGSDTREAGRIGNRPERAAIYPCDSGGAAVVYDAVCATVSKIRTAQPLKKKERPD